MGRGHRQPIGIRHPDRHHGHDLGRRPLGIGQVVLPIFSPTVTTMRFQPTMVPSPSASATDSFTRVAMNVVPRSSAVRSDFNAVSSPH
jgi:hypothetical protein